MRIFWLFLCLYFLPTCLSAQGNRFLIVRKGGKYGAINETGKLIIPTQYDTLCMVGYINQVLAAKNDFWGVLGRQGDTIVPIQYKHVRPLSNIGWLVLAEGKHTLGMYNKAGKLILPTEYTRITQRGNELNRRSIDRMQRRWLYIAQHKRHGVADTTGKIWIKCAYDSLTYLQKDSTAGFLTYEGKKQGFIEENQLEETLPAEYDSLAFLSRPFLLVGKGKKFGIYNFQTRQFILPIRFDKIDIILPNNKQGYFTAKRGERLQTYSLTGKILIPEGDYDEAILDSAGIFRVRKDDLWGIAGERGVLSPIFDDIKPFVGNLALVRKAKNLGLINSAGEIIIAPTAQPFTVRGNTIRVKIHNEKTEVLTLDAAGRVIKRDNYGSFRSLRVKLAGEREINSSDYAFDLLPPLLPTAQPLPDSLSKRPFTAGKTRWEYDTLRKHWTAYQNDKNLYDFRFRTLIHYPSAGIFATVHRATSKQQSITKGTIYNTQTGKAVYSFAYDTLAFINIINTFSRDKLLADETNKRYLNRTGQIIKQVRHQGENKDTPLAFVNPFNAYGVSRFGTWSGEGLMDEKGRVLYLANEVHISEVPTSGDKFWFLHKNGCMGLLDSLGREIVPAKYADIQYFYSPDNSCFALKSLQEFNVLDAAGRATTEWADSISHYSKGIIALKQKNYWTYVLPALRNFNARRRERTGRASYVRETSITTYGKYIKVGKFSGTIPRAWAMTMKRKRWILLTTSLRSYRVPRLDSVQDFVDKYAIVGTQGKFGLMRPNGSWYYKPKFERIERLGESGFLACYLKKEGKYVLLNSSLRPVGNLCDDFQVHNRLYITLRYGDKEVIHTLSGSIVKALPKNLPPNAAIPPPAEPKVRHKNLPYDVVDVELNGLTRVMNKAGNRIIDTAGNTIAENFVENFDAMRYLGDGIFYVAAGKAWGYWSKAGWLWQPTE